MLALAMSIMFTSQSYVRVKVPAVLGRSSAIYCLFRAAMKASQATRALITRPHGPVVLEGYDVHRADSLTQTAAYAVIIHAETLNLPLCGREELAYQPHK